MLALPLVLTLVLLFVLTPVLLLVLTPLSPQVMSSFALLSQLLGVGLFVVPWCVRTSCSCCCSATSPLLPG